MKSCLPILLSLCLFMMGNYAFAQAKPAIAAVPAWVTPNNIDYNKTSLDKHANDGYIDVSYEQQVSLAGQASYFRSSKKIISQAGVQNGSEISVSFDPSYEQLTFHTVRIIRAGAILNRLNRSSIQTIHQEKELTNFIYNGLLNALIILEDVRQGDIIEYSYTIKGFNPIFNNKYTEEFDLNFSMPLYQVYYRLLVPGDKTINIKYLNQKPTTTISQVDGQQVYEWRANNVAPVVPEDYLPSWYNPYSQILVSEFNSWKEVNDWARKLFPTDQRLSVSLQQKIREIETAFVGAEDRVKAALRFVQDEIRYMGIELGVNSHKPADPSKVFAQRFGDCKEKSFLLCCMLNAMHIEANPVLINTRAKSKLHELLPASGSFDHVTVRVKIGDRFYWFDPTIAFQRGSINDIFYPDYQSGLVISDTTQALTDIAFKNTSSLYVKEHFKVDAMTGSGIFTVTTQYKGSEADDIRSAFSNEAISEKMTGYRKFYAAYYEDIKADSLSYSDDDTTGIFTTREYYTIPNFWTGQKDKQSKFSFAPFVIDALIRKPKEKNRAMPLALPYPARYREELVIELPQEWLVTENETHLKNSSFTFNSRFYCVYNQVHLDTDYETLKDHAGIEEFAGYLNEIKQCDEVSSFQITSGIDVAVSKQPATSTAGMFSAVLLAGAIAGGLVWWGKKRDV